MKRRMGRILALSILSVVFMGLFSVAYALNLSADGAIDWVKSKEGERVGSGQCVALVAQYIRELGSTPPSVEVAAQYATCAVPSGFTRLSKADSTPRKGDILIWKGNSGYGHVAIYESDYSCWHQNVSNKLYVQNLTYYYTLESWDATLEYWGVMRPNFSGDNTPPVISNVQVSDITRDGYTVSCQVSDNVGVTKVQFPAWTPDTSADGTNQDDIVWHAATKGSDGVTWSCFISTSQHNDETGCRYWTDIYAYDAAGNRTVYSEIHNGYVMTDVPGAETTWVNLDEATFPGAVFRAYVADNFDENGDGLLDPGEVESIKRINLYAAGIYDVTDLTGIEYFTELVYLSCPENQLQSLDVSHNPQLEYLDCKKNQLISLNVSANDKLKELSCSFNQLTRLDLTANTGLSHLYCDGNQFANLNVSANDELKILSCDQNQLTRLDLSANTKLTHLSCGFNQLTSLDLSSNPNLIQILCYGNQLTGLNVSANEKLVDISCSDNQLRSLVLLNNTSLGNISCARNRLDTLDISRCPKLLEIYENGTHSSYDYADNESWPVELYELYDGAALHVDRGVRIITSSQGMLQPGLVLPSTVTTIEESAFEGSSVGVVYIPDTCTRIGKWAFRNCKNLKQIRIPANCTVGSEAFSGCPEVVIFGTTGSPAQTYAENHANCSFVAE